MRLRSASVRTAAVVGLAALLQLAPAGATTTPPSGSLVSASMSSVSLGTSVPLTIYLPPGYRASGVRYPVLYLLHGVPGTGDRMLRKLNVVSLVSRLIDEKLVRPLIIVAPTDGPKMNTDTEWMSSRVNETYRWGDFVTDDLVSHIDDTFAACPVRSGRAIGGLSMGAFGAINDALKNPLEFGSATLWSPYFVSNSPLVDGPVGSVGWAEDSPLYYLPEIAATLRADPVRISYFDSPGDPFYDQDVAFSKELASLGLPYRFRTVSGPHTYDLWSEQFENELIWLSSGLHC